MLLSTRYVSDVAPLFSLSCSTDLHKDPELLILSPETAHFVVSFAICVYIRSRKRFDKSWHKLVEILGIWHLPELLNFRTVMDDVINDIKGSLQKPSGDLENF